MDKKQEFLKMMDERHACKIFDDSKKIQKSDLDYILEVGRLSPSSFGMEPWRYIVVQSQNLKEQIKPLCWDQPQITTCSDLLIILADVDNVKPQNSYVKKMFSRRDLPNEAVEKYLSVYANHLEEVMQNSTTILSWTAKQCYLGLANMMSAASFIDIDSCPIEGFEKDNLEKLFNIDTSKEQIAVICAFGYRLNPKSNKLRKNIQEIVEYR